MRKIYCPVNDESCPCLKIDGTCSLVDEGVNPAEECDDYYAVVGDDEE